MGGVFGGLFNSREALVIQLSEERQRQMHGVGHAPAHARQDATQSGDLTIEMRARLVSQLDGNEGSGHGGGFFRRRRAAER